MHRYEELEKLYYKKMIIKYFIIIFSLILIFIAIFFVWKKELKHNKPVKITTNAKTVKKPKKEIITHKIVKPNIKKHIVEENISFILPKLEIEHLKSKKTVKTTFNKQTITKSNPKIQIIEKTPDLKELIKKFNQTNDFDLAIVIAKKFLNKNDLKNAQIWALRANSINPSSYKSWILFANILLKEKKIKKAKEILKVYISSYGQNDIIEKKLRSLDDE